MAGDSAITAWGVRLSPTNVRYFFLFKCDMQPVTQTHTCAYHLGQETECCQTPPTPTRLGALPQPLPLKESHHLDSCVNDALVLAVLPPGGTTLFFFLMFIFETETEREWGRGRGRHRVQSRLQALSCQHRARCGARTHERRDHDLSRSRRLNRLSHPGAPAYQFLKNVSINLV